ncbi:MAG: low molecular weight phosphotyrosine protein phosphatase [Flavobacteriaceae bacterium]|nr:low molecular weight phosphotyrosine protein phosphatase [Flavobacteriaceae bacterium]
MKKTKILMVCLGNICRSPLAEGILQDKLDPTRFSVSSAGTGSWHVGNPPDPRSIDIAKKRGLDISRQTAQQFKASFFDEFDLIYAMDQSNFSDLKALAKTPEQLDKLSLILDAIFPGEGVDVPDPYYGGASGFSEVYDLIDRACIAIAHRIDKKND